MVKDCFNSYKVGTHLPYNGTQVFLIYFQWCNNPGQTLRPHRASLWTKLIWGISMTFGMMAIGKDQTKRASDSYFFVVKTCCGVFECAKHGWN